METTDRSFGSLGWAMGASLLLTTVIVGLLLLVGGRVSAQSETDLYKALRVLGTDGGFDPQDVAMGDLDGDGYDEIILLSANSGCTTVNPPDCKPHYIFHNKQTENYNQFVLAAPLDGQNDLRSVLAVDINSDGRDELLLVSNNKQSQICNFDGVDFVRASTTITTSSCVGFGPDTGGLLADVAYGPAGTWLIALAVARADNSYAVNLYSLSGQKVTNLLEGATALPVTGVISDLALARVFPDFDRMPDLLIASNSLVEFYKGEYTPASGVRSYTFTLKQPQQPIGPLKAQSLLVDSQLVEQSGGDPFLDPAELVIGATIYMVKLADPGAPSIDYSAIVLEKIQDLPTVTGMGDIADAITLDVDGDKRRDVMTVGNEGRYLIALQQDQTSNPTATLFEKQTLPEPAQIPKRLYIAAGSINQDGFDNDLVFVAKETQINYLASANGRPLPWNLYARSCTPITAVVAGDVDNDSRIDLVVANKDTIIRVDRRRLDGVEPQCDLIGRTIAGQSVAPISGTVALAIADLDDDRDYDLIAGRDGQESRILWNEGIAGFTQKALIPPGTTTDLTSTLFLATGDLDGDSDIDVVAASPGGFQILKNTGDSAITDERFAVGRFRTVPADKNWSLSALALADLDRDGDLDLILGHNPGPGWVLINDGRGNFERLPHDQADFGSASSETTGLAVADFDDDGNPDIVVSYRDNYAVLYYNTRIRDSLGRPTFYSGPLSNANCLQNAIVCFQDSPTNASGVVAGDLNQDGNTDLLITSAGSNNGIDTKGFLNRIYLNQGQRSFTADRRFGFVSTQHVLVANIDELGGPEVVADNTMGGTRNFLDVFRYTSYVPALLSVDILPPTGLPRAPAAPSGLIVSGPTIPISFTLRSLYYPNLKVGNIKASYSLDGGGRWITAKGSTTPATPLVVSRPIFTQHATSWVELTAPTALNLGDDAVSEVITSSFAFPFAGTGYQQIYIGSNGWISLGKKGAANLYQNNCSPANLGAPVIAPLWTDLNPSTGGQIRYQDFGDRLVVSYENVPRFGTSDTRYTFQVILKPDGAITFQYGALPQSVDNATVAIWIGTPELFSATLLACNVFRSYNGTNDFNLASDQAVDLIGDPSAQTYTFNWNVADENLFGQYDNVAFRIQASEVSTTDDHEINGAFTAQSPPFRLNASQVRVVIAASDTKTPQAYLPLVGSGGSIPNAPIDAITATKGFDDSPLVFKIHGETTSLLADSDGRPLRTNAAGYLLGRASLQDQDRLVALTPITATDSFTVYLSSSAPLLNDLDAPAVAVRGTNVLTTTPEHPLIVFDLTVSLEWDVRGDDQYVVRLKRDLERASAFLYDWTNGQAALGTIHIFDGGKNWETADVQIFASNRVRPSAVVDGLRLRLADIQNAETSYSGRVRLGATWNRSGQPGAAIGDDWPAALTHELGHYLFGLYDNYLGLQPFQGGEVLVSTDTCQGVMSDPYADRASEFRTRADWLPTCASTLTHQTYGLPDWVVMSRVFPWLRPPTEPFSADSGNAGPDRLLLPLLKFDDQALADSAEPGFAAPIFNLTRASADAASPGAQAYLLQCANTSVACTRDTASRVIDLGQPLAGEIFARGARLNDLLCVFDLGAVSPQTNAPTPQSGCKALRQSGEQIGLGPAWNPTVQLEALDGATLQIRVSGVPAGRTLSARHYPTGGTADKTFPLLPTPQGGYIAAITTGELLSGMVHVWDTGAGTDRETIAAYGLFGSPARGGRGGPTSLAPALSPDGQVIIFKRGLTFDEGQFYTIQPTAAPTIPEWATLVGQAYEVIQSPNAPDLGGASISVSYLERDVPSTEEQGLELYKYNATTKAWELQPTVLSTDENTASALLQGEGIYALMSSIQVELRPEWNAFAYNSVLNRPVAQALRSIEGAYDAVLTYDASNPEGPWLIYDPYDASRTTLHTLVPGRGYLIYANGARILRLRGGRGAGLNATGAEAGAAPATPPPPALYSGQVLLPQGATLAPGTPVIALIDGKVCGHGRTGLSAGLPVYSLAVSADGASSTGCGALGRPIIVKIGAVTVKTELVWANDRPYAQTLDAR